MPEDKLTLGEYFKREREKKGLDLKEIEDRTKISAQTLIFLEENQLDMLPPRTFLRGFLRVISKEFHFDEEELLAHLEDTLSSHENRGKPVKVVSYRSRSMVPMILIAAAAALPVAGKGSPMSRAILKVTTAANRPFQVTMASGSLPAIWREQLVSIPQQRQVKRIPAAPSDTPKAWSGCQARMIQAAVMHPSAIHTLLPAYSAKKTAATRAVATDSKLSRTDASHAGMSLSESVRQVVARTAPKNEAAMSQGTAWRFRGGSSLLIPRRYRTSHWFLSHLGD